MADVVHILLMNSHSKYAKYINKNLSFLQSDCYRYPVFDTTR